jgi:hypothetical protein
VIPFYGPSTVRDAFSLYVDRRYDVIRQINDIDTRHVVQGLFTVDRRANLLRTVDVLQGAAIDRYAFTRDAYCSYRRASIDDQGKEDIPPPLPDESGDAPAGNRSGRARRCAPKAAAGSSRAATGAATPAPASEVARCCFRTRSSGNPAPPSSSNGEPRAPSRQKG